MTQRRCLTCDAGAPADARFCGRCGAALPTTPDDRTGDGSGTATPAAGGVRPASSAARQETADDRPTLVVPLRGRDRPTDDPGGRGRRGRGPRRVLAGGALALLVVVVVVAVSTPQQDAIVLGDGLVLPSGSGPGDRPARLWGVTVPVSDPLPPLVVDATIVLGGTADDVAVVVGVDVASGRTLWRAPLGLDLEVVAVLPVGDDVLTVATDGAATAVARYVARTGRPVWTTRSVLFGGAVAATALPGGQLLVELGGTSEQRGRAVVLGAAGERVLDVDADVAAAAADLVAVVDGTEVGSFSPDGDPVATTTVDDTPVDALALAGGLVVVAQGTTVAASDARTGRPRWSTSLDDPVVALAPSPVGVAAITVGDHVGLGLDGEQRWRADGYPLPLVRDGDQVVALVAPGVEDAVVVEVRGADGRIRSTTGVRLGQYVALGGTTVLSAVGDTIIGTAVDAGTPPWRVTAPGEVEWVVLDGPRMVVAADGGGDTSLSSWR